ncbi:TIGR02301 family protein [Rhizobiaceae bacterium]|nr:TIGR02301 family protein [Rhizobiaceae bacterium]
MLRALALLVLLTAPAQSQDAVNTPPPPPEQAAPAPEPVAPYDLQLLRLAEVLGSIHYLRTLCVPDEGPRWRESMSEIVALEQPTPERRARLISRFNRGYRAFDGNYITCTASARLAADRYVAEGASLSAAIVQRFGR